MRTPIKLATFSVALALLAALPAQVDAQSRVPSSRGAVRGGGPAVRGPAVARPVVRGPVTGPVGGHYGSYYRPGYSYYRPYYPYYPYYRPYYGSAYFGFGYPWYGYSPWSFSIGFGFGYGYPYAYGYPYGAYGSWYGPYPYGAYPYPYAYQIDDATSDVRIDVAQIKAEVYVDGYRAGTVDDFDGMFQRLHVRPGEHELVLYLKGYRTVREPLFLNARSTKTIRLDMEPLQPGENSEPPPAPKPREERDRDPEPDPQSQPQSQRPYRPAEPDQRIEVAPTRFGTLSLRVQPVDAEVLIDGERWTTTQGEGRITIQLSPGRHKIEIRKDGFERYSEEIGVRENTVFSLNVSLKRVS